MLHHSQPTALSFSLIVLLGHFFARLDIREHFSSEALLGTGLLHVYMLSPKEKKTCGSHLIGSRFECSVNNNVILNTQISIR